jgi:hypothetical protein
MEETHKKDPLERIADAVESLASSVAIIAAALSKPVIGPVVKIQLEIEGEIMAKAGAAVAIVDTANKRLIVVGLDSLGAKGAQLGTGASILVSSADLTIASLVPDASPVADPDGNPSIYSAVITPTTPPVTGKTVTLTAQVTNADGTQQNPMTVDILWTPGTEASLELEEA